MTESITPLLASAVGAAIPLIIAGLGELISERGGVLNLGLEGMMLLGALASFMTVANGGGLFEAVILGMAAGLLASLIFGFVTITLQANQVAAGLSLTILGAGLSAFLGRTYVGFGAPTSFSPAPIPVLKEIPLLGPSLFSLDLLGYAALLLLVAVSWFLSRSRAGLTLKAVGESPVVARSLGLPVTRVRYMAVAFGGAMSGLAGSYYSVAQFKMWQEGSLAHGGANVEYTYRVVRPLTAILTKVPEAQAGFHEAISLHVQPVAEEASVVWIVLAITNFEQSEAEVRAFQDRIFLQDKPIVENQVPKCLPLAPNAELPLRSDRMSVAYRSYLRETGMRYGVIDGATI